jgi:hypothetical protein
MKTWTTVKETTSRIQSWDRNTSFIGLTSSPKADKSRYKEGFKYVFNIIADVQNQLCITAQIYGDIRHYEGTTVSRLIRGEHKLRRIVRSNGMKRSDKLIIKLRD